jgi:hypothetical protein
MRRNFRSGLCGGGQRYKDEPMGGEYYDAQLRQDSPAVSHGFF